MCHFAWQLVLLGNSQADYLRTQASYQTAGGVQKEICSGLTQMLLC